LKLKNRFVAILIALIPAFFAMQCQKENMGMISREQEIELGRKVDSMIINSPARFPILDTALYHNAYAYIDTMLSEILQSVHFQRKNAFNYQVRIIDRELLHAYATPGGYLYFYKGLINLLDNGAEFAGVMAHEMVHVDRRHITGNLETEYHIDPLLSVVWGGNSSVLAEITGYLTRESGPSAFSDQQEYEADEFALKCLADTDFDPRGILYFFNKLNQSAQTGNQPDFLLIHSDPGNRIETIEKMWEELGSPEGDLFTSEYANFKLSL
jgi:predicted Zn-dependent protease